MQTVIHGRNVNHCDCPTIEASKWIGDFWNLAIFRELSGGPQRFNQLVTQLPDINKATLSKKLKELCEAGFITRVVSEESPPTVSYTFTTKGKQLCPVLNAIETFGKAVS